MPDSGMDYGDLPAWFALVVSLVTAFNQFRTSSNSEKIRQADEQRSKQEREADRQKLRIEQMMKDIEDLSAMSVDYWMRSGSDTGTAGVLINSKIRDLSSRVYRYSNFLWPSAGQDFLLLKQAITGGSFQSVTRVAAKGTSPTIRSVTLASSSLKDGLREAFDKLDMRSNH